MEKKLYLVKTRSYRAYVVAATTDEAWNIFKSWLEKDDGYGFSEDRLLESIEVIASSSAYKPLPIAGRGLGNKGDDLLFA